MNSHNITDKLILFLNVAKTENKNNQSINSYHFPAFCVPCCILFFKECIRLPGACLLHDVTRWRICCNLHAFGRPGGSFAFPLLTDFRLLADRAFTGILLPRLK